jgi:hypothetical protein
MPEFGSHGASEEFAVLRFGGFWRRFCEPFNDTDWKSPLQYVAWLMAAPALSVYYLVGFAILVILFGPALIYRWALKATSISYLPLLWIVRSTFRKITDLTAALRRYRKSDLAIVTVVYSAVIIVFFVGKIICMIGVETFAAWWNEGKLTKLLSIYVRPSEIPIWQIAAFINAILAIGLFWFAGEALLRKRERRPWSDLLIERVIRSTTFFRCVLTLYTVHLRADPGLDGRSIG